MALYQECHFWNFKLLVTQVLAVGKESTAQTPAIHHQQVPIHTDMKQMDDHMSKVKGRQLNTQKLITSSCEGAVESLGQAKAGLDKHIADTVCHEVQKAFSRWVLVFKK